MAADGDPFLGATVAGRFVVLGKLGAGSMGTVYRARQEVMGRDVAVKILRADRAFDATAKARFAREARAMSLLSSPHTVTVFDFGEIPDQSPDELAPRDASLYLAMELLEGESLGARLKRRGRLPVEEAARITREALLSLAEAHDKGIIHRDLKPDNLFLSRAPTAPTGEMVKVLDFGIAKLRVEPNVDALETQAGTVFGTPRYMSPEQAQGKDLDARSDLYTLGVLLYQMLVGRPPFVDDDAVVVMARHIKSTAVPPADAAPDAGIGSALSALVVRALAKDPDDRPRTARAFLAELEAAVRARGNSVRPAAGASGEVAAMVHDELHAPPVTTRSPGSMPRTRAALVVGTSAAVVVSAGLFALGALRPARVPVARAEIGHFVAGRLLTLMQAEAAASATAAAGVAAAPPAAAPSASVEPEVPAPVTSAAPAVRRPAAKKYRRFDP
jgi:eukaryotic-like serine/threonine-protein kinase